MPDQEEEIKRLQRLRDKQLAYRNPSEKRMTYFKNYKQRHSKPRPVTFKGIITTFSKKVRGLILGVLVGVVIWLLLPSFLTLTWIDLLGALITVVLGAAGAVVGASLDWRDDLKDF